MLNLSASIQHCIQIRAGKAAGKPLPNLSECAVVETFLNLSRTKSRFGTARVSVCFRKKTVCGGSCSERETGHGTTASHVRESKHATGVLRFRSEDSAPSEKLTGKYVLLFYFLLKYSLLKICFAKICFAQKYTLLKYALLKNILC